MNNLFKKIVMTSILLAITMGNIAIVNYMGKTNEIIVQTAVSNLSNSKIGWGIKRAKDHGRPDLGSKNKQLIDEYEGIAIGNSQKKYVYLTFDEGYEAGYTPRILQILKENDVRATFFLTAHYINTRRGTC